MQTQNKAVVLLNMGGPNSLDEVATFLKNMFADPCILSVKSEFFRSMLGNVIVNSRIEKSKKEFCFIYTLYKIDYTKLDSKFILKTI